MKDWALRDRPPKKHLRIVAFVDKHGISLPISSRRFHIGELWVIPSPEIRIPSTSSDSYRVLISLIVYNRFHFTFHALFHLVLHYEAYPKS